MAHSRKQRPTKTTKTTTSAPTSAPANMFSSPSDTFYIATTSNNTPTLGHWATEPNGLSPVESQYKALLACMINAYYCNQESCDLQCRCREARSEASKALESRAMSGISRDEDAYLNGADPFKALGPITYEKNTGQDTSAASRKFPGGSWYDGQSAGGFMGR
jgi:hypothetical protein